jgi:hypothetical protein
MKRICILLLFAVSVSGCAGTQQIDEASSHVNSPEINLATAKFGTSQKRNLATARIMLQENRITAATEILSEICSAKGVPGVTDEALFRLALLYYDAGQGKNDVNQAQQHLERLVKEYPSSSWKNHADSLLELIATLNRKIRYLRGENLSLTRENKELRSNIEKLRNLRGENLSLTRENKELRLNIEKLKTLDIEQELKERSR